MRCLRLIAVVISLAVFLPSTLHAALNIIATNIVATCDTGGVTLTVTLDPGTYRFFVTGSGSPLYYHIDGASNGVLATGTNPMVFTTPALSAGIHNLLISATGAASQNYQFVVPNCKKGVTWVHSASNAQTGTITVGCGSSGPSPCGPIHGDTLCTQLRPLLCIYKPSPPAPPFQVPAGVNNSDRYYRWSGGVVATTQPVAGSSFSNLRASLTPTQNADHYCELQFGPGWRVAEFHDGWGWNFQAYGGTVSAPTVPSTRFWVEVNDQPDANCWATP
jgi:hypothetical protein